MVSAFSLCRLLSLTGVRGFSTYSFKQGVEKKCTNREQTSPAVVLPYKEGKLKYVVLVHCLATYLLSP